MPLYDLKPQHAAVAKGLRRAVVKVIDSGVYILGPEGAAFEREFASTLGARHAVGVASGTEAISLALMALGVGVKDEVIVPAFTFIATAGAVSALGAVPVFADVDDQTLTLDPISAQAAVTPRTKVILPVHLYGQTADMDGLKTLARRRRLKIVEDCAQAHLTRYRGKMAGTLGDAAAFSFYPSKNLGAAGDAGALTMQDAELAEDCRQLRNAGRKKGSWYRHDRLGANSRLDELQAAVLRVKLKWLKAWTQDRRRIAARYAEEFSGLPLRLPDPGSNGSEHSFHLYVVRHERRDALARHLANKGIATGVYYPIPLHLQPAYRSLGYSCGDFPVAERACREVLALPLYPGLTEGAVLAVSRAVRSFFKT